KKIDLPILRKDFIIDPYQLAEAAVWGADIILLIARILSPKDISALAERARSYGLEVLFEVHDAEDLQKLPNAGECILGINNRDLQTFNVSLNTTQTLMKSVPDKIPVISESGVFTADDIRFLKSCGVRGALIGESFMKTPSPGKALKSLIDGYNE
ncbi:MAG: indole-3-glycerol-phosphate synthase, partial [Candidatus Omnitrophica bacterium]|nr:indole-3-glycerol-phosphate synthase [Candidatus Omnitrophota bacterium]